MGMFVYTVKRGLLFLPMLVGVTVVAFALIQLVPGDPVGILLGDSATPEQIALMRYELGLDQPLLVQFTTYVTNLLHGDLGNSIFMKEPVLSLILERLPATLELAFGAILVSVLIGVPLGVVAAMRQGGLVDFLVLVFAQLGVALTVFWLAILLMYVFAVELNWLPAINRGVPLVVAMKALLLEGRLGPLADSLSHLILPSIAMGLQGAAMICRLVRASMLEVLGSHFVRTARAKGVRERRVVWRHALSNALLPVVTVIGLQFGNLLSGAVLVEGIFGWPGLGQLTVGAISQRDFPLVQGIALSFAVLVGLINLLTDLAYALIDPRIRV
ncbi:ABC transporter permease [Nitratireductor sp. StC3]|uniref:ABC transporter permease n=1 Tax=Nitratireductor sp. StC3 TaxID=2126741 RepID=UPI001FE12B56|nr:ABC transporter permease [Nitratireductor sp. StC3]